MAVRFRKLLVVLFLLTVSATARGADSEPDTSYLEKKIDLLASDVALEDVAADLGEKAELVVAVAPPLAAKHRRVSIALRGVSWREALDRVARDTNARLRSVPGGVLLEERTVPAKVTLSAKGMALREAIAAIVSAGPMSLVVAPDVTGTIDLDVKDEPWPRVLRSVLEPRGLHAVVRGEILLVSARGPASGEVELGLEEPDPPIRWPLRVAEDVTKPIDAEVEDADLRDVMDEIGRRVGRNILVEAAANASVTLAITKCPWRKAVEVFAGDAGAVVHEASGILLVRKPERVTVSASGELTRTLQQVAAVNTKNLIVGPGVTGDILVQLRDVEWSEALSAIGSACGAPVTRMGRRGEVTVVTARPVADGVAAERSLIDDLDAALGAARGLDRNIDVSVEEAELRDVLDAIVKKTGGNVVVEHEIKATLTASLRKVRAKHAIELLSRMGVSETRLLPGGIVLVEQPARITIGFYEADTRVTLFLLAAYSGRNIIVAPDVGGGVTLDLRDVNWLTALEAVACACGLHVTQLASGITVVSAAPPSHRPEPAPTWRQERDPQVLVDLSFEEADLRDVVAHVVSATRVRISVAPDVREKLTVSLRDVDWRDAVDAVARLANCRIDRRGAEVKLSQPPKVLLQTSDVSAQSWFKLLGLCLGEKTVRVDPDVKGTVTLDLHELSFEDALVATARAHGYGVVRSTDGGFAISSRTTSLARRPRTARRSEGIPAPRVAPARDEWRERREGPARALLPKLAGASADDIARLDFEPVFREWRGVEGLRSVLEKSPPEGLDAEAKQVLEAWLEVGRGHEVIGEMRYASERGRFDEIPEHRRELEAIVDKVKLVERDELSRAADGLTKRAKETAERANKLEAIDENFPLVVRAIVIDSREGGKNRAVIVADDLVATARCYAEGDSLLDRNGKRLPVKIVRICEGAIEFSHDGTKFVVQLVAPGE